MRVVGHRPAESTCDGASSRDFTELVRELDPRVRGYVMRRLPATEVDDVVAEVFLVLWRRRESLPGTSDERAAWVFGIAHRCVLSAGRSLRRRAQVTARVAAAATETVLGADPAEIVAASRDADERLRVLSDEQAAAVRLVITEGWPVEDAAAVLGISCTALTSRLHRARRVLVRQRAAETSECEADHHRFA